MSDEYEEFILGKERTAGGIATVRVCPFCGSYVEDYEKPGGFEIHIAQHSNLPDWESVMSGRKKPV